MTSRRPTSGSSQTTATPVGGSIGSPADMSPEPYVGDGVDLRSDVYPLGVVVVCRRNGRTECPKTAEATKATEPVPRRSFIFIHEKGSRDAIAWDTTNSVASVALAVVARPVPRTLGCLAARCPAHDRIPHATTATLD